MLSRNRPDNAIANYHPSLERSLAFARAARLYYACIYELAARCVRRNRAVSLVKLGTPLSDTRLNILALAPYDLSVSVYVSAYLLNILRAHLIVVRRVT